VRFLNRVFSTSTLSKGFFALLLVWFVLGIGAACNNGRNSQNTSSNPIIGLLGIFFSGTSIDDTTGLQVLFGNVDDVGVVDVEVDDSFPDGSTYVMSLDSTNAFQSIGCLFNPTGVIVNGQASSSVLSGPNILGGDIAARAVVTVTTPFGESNSDFISFILRNVTLAAATASASQNITVPACPVSPENPAVFATITLNSVGLPDGTQVDFTVSDPALGVITPNPAFIFAGTVFVEYAAMNEAGGTQVINAAVVLPNPIDVNPICPSVPIADRTLNAVAVINQSAVPCATPTPTPTP